ncbi:MAG: hypothetical protein ACRYFX_28840 [Janthinobacterium lividum]
MKPIQLLFLLLLGLAARSQTRPTAAEHAQHVATFQQELIAVCKSVYTM